MTSQKEENIKNKNQKLLNKIKRYEIKNKKMKGNVNNTILMHLAGLGGNNNSNISGLVGDNNISANGLGGIQ